MGKGAKILGILLLLLAIGCFAMYFVYGSQFGEFTVTFDSNGGSTVTSQVVKSGLAVTRPADPTKEDNDFIAWQLNGVDYNFASPVKSNITLTAKWEEYNKFDVIVMLEDKEYSIKVRENESFTQEDLNLPPKEGNVIKVYLNDAEYDFNTKVTSDMELIAKYLVLKTYTVKFDSSGGSKVPDVKVIEGDKLQEPEAPTKAGYAFAEWYLGNQKFDFSTPITKDITLKAKWNDGSKFTVTFEVDGKTYKEVQVKENNKVAKPTNPTKAGYAFVEWQLDGEAYDFSKPVTGNLTLKATFKEVESYTVKFNSNGGTTVKDATVNAGSKVTKPADPTRDGYDFVEWVLNGKAYDFSKAVNSNITLTASWQVKAPTYKVTFDSNGGSAVAAKTVVEGKTVAKPENPTKTDYSFVEWQLDGEAYDFNTPVTGNITLKATWKDLEYFVVSFDSDGGTSIPSQRIASGDKAIRPSEPTKEGSTFAGWQLNGQNYDFNTGVTANITLKAKWTTSTENSES